MPHGNEMSEINISDAEIADRALEHWKQRGCPEGDPQCDWFTARAELTRERSRRAYEARIAQYE